MILFHAFPGRLPGGFAGVDIFFVISGYLISGIVLRDLCEDRFRLAEFYARRIRRIFPALSVVLVSVMAIGWILLTSEEWRSLTGNVVAGAGFFSNLRLAGETGYFDTEATRNPLLHLWSLGIEEQFYLVWPVTLVLLWKAFRSPFPFIALLAVVSLVADVATVGVHPAVAFYYPHTRMWELLVGAAVVECTNTRGLGKGRLGCEGIGALGALIIVASFAFLNGTKPYPGWWTLLPVVGAASLLYAGSGSWINRNVFSSRGIVWSGLISYPLYLWHWPMLVFLRLITDDHPLARHASVAARIALLALAVLLARGTWRLVEVPMRFSATLSSALRVRLVSGAMVAALALGFFGERAVPSRLALAGDVDARVAQDRRDIPVNARDSAPGTFRLYEANAFPPPGSSASAPAALLVGDSHMEQYWPRVEAARKANPHLLEAVFAVHDGCPPLPGLNREPPYRCPEFFEYWSAQAASPRFRTVAVSAFWEIYTIGMYSGYAGAAPRAPVRMIVDGRDATSADYDRAWKGLAATLRSLTRAGKRVVILRSSPAAMRLRPLRRLSFQIRGVSAGPSRNEMEKFLAPVNERIDEVARASGAEVISPFDALCRGDVCPVLDLDGSPVYRDVDHLRASKAVVLATFIDDVLRVRPEK